MAVDSDVRKAVDNAVLNYGKLDIMFNNAGISGNMDPRILATHDQDFKQVININLFGAYLGAKHAARVMVPNKRGSILFTSSMASVICGEAPHAYVASKHAVVGLAKNLSVELGKYGIRVNCISPFGVVTPMMSKSMGLDKRKGEEVVAEAANLKGTVLEAEDIAEAALYLGSDDSKYVSGINLVVDGGYSVTNPMFPMVIKKLFSQEELR